MFIYTVTENTEVIKKYSSAKEFIDDYYESDGKVKAGRYDIIVCDEDYKVGEVPDSETSLYTDQLIL